MKTGILFNPANRIILFALAATVVTACSKRDDNTTPGAPVPVSFSAGIGQAATPAPAPVSRASGTAWDLNDPVGIYMLENGGTTVLAGNRHYKITDAGTGALSAVAGSDLYYPQDGSTVDFIAYYPRLDDGAGGIGNNTYPVDVSGQSRPADIDLLWARADRSGTGYDKTNPAVALGFEHKLTKLIIETKAAPGVGSMTGMGVTLRGMDTETTFDLIGGTLGTTSTPADIVPVTVLDGKQYEAIILPCTISALGDVSVLFMVGPDPYVWNIPVGTVFDGGEEHTWTVTLTPTGVTATGSIQPWTPKTHPGQTAE